MKAASHGAKAALVDELAHELEATMPLRGPVAAAGTWAIGLASLSVTFLFATGGFRPDVLGQLVASVPLLAETLLAALGLCVAALAGTHLSIPGVGHRGVWLGLLASLLTAWVASFALGLHQPHVEVSMIGKRPFCYLQVLSIGIVGLGIAVPLVRRRFALKPAIVLGSLAGGAAAFAAMLMQLACMYEPNHAISHHLAPALGLAAITALLAPYLVAHRT